MATENIVISFEANTQGIDATIAHLEKMGKVSKSDADAFKQAGNSAKEFGDKASKSFDDLGKKAEESGKKMSSATKDAGKDIGSLSDALNKLATTVGIAFSVEKVLEFGKASVLAFAEAEKGRKQLLNALGNQKSVQEGLIKQAEQLKDATGIDDDVIVKQQAFLAIQGRTEGQIKKTIQAAIELSAVTGEDLASSVEKLDATYEGNIGRLGKLDSGFTKLSQTELANGAAIDLVNQKYKGFAEGTLNTTDGQLRILQTRIDDLKKGVGEALVGVAAEAFNAAKIFGAVLEKFLPERAKELEKSEDAFNKFFDSVEKRLGSTSRGDFAKVSDEILASVQASVDAEQKRIDDFARARDIALKQVKGNKDEELRITRSFNEAIRKETNTNLKGEQDRLEHTKQLIEKYRELKFTLSADEIKNADDLKKFLDKQANNDEQRLKGAFEFEQSLAEQAENDRKKLLVGRNLTQDQLDQELADAHIEKLKRIIEIGKALNQDVTKFESDLLNAQLKQPKQGEIVGPGRKELLEQDKILADGQIEIEKKKAEKIKEIESQLFNDLTKLGQNYLEQLLFFSDLQAQEATKAVDAERDARNAGIEDEIAKLEEKHNKRLIGDKRYQKELKRLDDEKKKNDEIARKKENEIKHQQDIANRERAIFEIAIRTAVNIAQFPLATPLYLGIGAAETALVLSQPLPKYHTGKRAKITSGEQLAIIRDDEDIFSPQKSKEYAPTFRAIHDGKIKPSTLNEFVTWQIKHTNATASNSFQFDYKRLASEIAWSMRGDKSMSLTNETILKMAKAIESNYDPRRK